MTMFNPLSTVMVAMLAYFIFGEKLHTGRCVRARMRERDNFVLSILCFCRENVSDFLYNLFCFCSIIGGIIVVGGLYTLLWGKDRDQEAREKSEGNSDLAYEEQGESNCVSDTGNCGKGDGSKEFHGI